MSTEVVKKQLTPKEKKNLISLIVSVLVMVVASVITIVAFTVTYKFVTKPNDFDEIFGAGYKEELVVKNTKDGVNYEVYKVADKGFVLVGEKRHSFDTGASVVDGFIGFKLAIDAEGVIKAYSFTKYDHSSGSWRDKVEAYLNSFVGTKIDDIEQTHVTNGSLIAGASQSGLQTVYPILQVLKEVK